MVLGRPSCRPLSHRSSTARRLQAEATTPRLKQYLRELIARCEGLAEKVTNAPEKH
jgi:hypothetical protein